MFWRAGRSCSVRSDITSVVSEVGMMTWGNNRASVFRPDAGLRVALCVVGTPRVINARVCHVFDAKILISQIQTHYK